MKENGAEDCRSHLSLCSCCSLATVSGLSHTHIPNSQGSPGQEALWFAKPGY